MGERKTVCLMVPPQDGIKRGARLAIAAARCQKPRASSDPCQRKSRLVSPPDPAQMRPRRFAAQGPLKGRIRVPGDKSISHRSIMLGALAVGRTRVTGLLEGEDVLSTAAAMRAMGAAIERLESGEWVIDGVGVGALLVPGSDLVIENVGLNPTRAALFDVLRLMGGRIEEIDRREVGGEPVADLRVVASTLTGIEVDPAVVPSMVDEFPVLFVAAALAQGRTVTRGLEELRVKESDRIAVMRAALELAGATVTETEDGLTIDGTGGEPLPGTVQGAAVATHLDHRIAMAMAVAGLASRAGVEVDDTRPIATSFPVFETLLAQTTGAA